VKFNAYIRSYNELIGDQGLTHEYQVYRDANISKKSPGNTIDIGTGLIAEQRDRLKSAYAMPGSNAPELDMAASRLIDSLDPLVTRLTGLKAYYQTKAYMDDRLTRGKHEDAQMLAEFKSASLALAEFNEQLEHESDRREEAELAKIKAGGDIVAYDTKLALHQAKGFIDLFHGPDDTTNASVLGQADAKISDLEKTLAAQREAVAKAKQTGRPDSSLGYFSNAGNALAEMIGEYRTMKELHRADKFHFVILEYNTAISMANEAR
jgi:hypothetical protein